MECCWLVQTATAICTYILGWLCIQICLELQGAEMMLVTAMRIPVNGLLPNLSMCWIFDLCLDSVDACVHCAAHWLEGNVDQQQLPASATPRWRNVKNLTKMFVGCNSQTLDKPSFVKSCIHPAGQPSWWWASKALWSFITKTMIIVIQREWIAFQNASYWCWPTSLMAL